jgi:nucleoid-associated protein YgaU
LKKNQLKSFRTLLALRTRRQDGLDRARTEARLECERLTVLAQDAATAIVTAQEGVDRQIDLIDRLTQSGNRFQIADYLAQQDYRTVLEEKVGVARNEAAQADAAVQQQTEVLRQKRTIAARNVKRCERLTQKIADGMKKLETEQLDNEDEEAEEAVVTRKRLLAERARRDAGAVHA